MSDRDACEIYSISPSVRIAEVFEQSLYKWGNGNVSVMYSTLKDKLCC